MASFKVMPSTSNSRNPDLSSLPSHHHHHHRPTPSSSPMISDFSPNSDRQRTINDLASSMSVDGILRGVYGENPAASTEATLLDAEITLIDAAGAISAIGASDDCGGDGADPSIRRQSSRKMSDEVWRDIMAAKSERKECKVEAPEEVITLEDFLAKAGAGMEVEEEAVVEDVKAPVSEALPSMGILTERINSGGGMFGYDHVVQSPYPALPVGECGGTAFGNGGGVEVVGGRGKRRGGPLLEPLDKAAQQRQRRMIKNRESAARSRERKQAYQVELESLAVKLEEENEQLLREKAERAKERYKQLMEKVIPVVEKRRPPRTLRRVHSSQW